MHKKIFISLMIIIFLISNLYSLIIIKKTDELDKKYLEDTYGEWYDFSAEQMLKGEFDEFMRLTKTGIIQDNSLSDDEKEKQINQLKELEFKRFKFIFFHMKTLLPVIGKYLNLKFRLTDVNGNDLIKDIKSFSFKLVWVSNAGSGEYYNYIWVIETNTTLDRKNISKDQKPILLEIEFPNGQKKIFEAKV